ncbi:hypothetical protein [Hyphomicrobium sp.]|jgi:hypothetical protein|uniref:hypothetical protein n=1 Tax=Hyphomicrobium sp. TaxID=82 RepID=UPI003568E011
MTGTFGSFDSAEVTVLQSTFDFACKELGVGVGDDEGRERIAKTVIALANAGQFDPDRLRASAISRLKAVEAEHAR